MIQNHSPPSGNGLNNSRYFLIFFKQFKSGEEPQLRQWQSK